MEVILAILCVLGSLYANVLPDGHYHGDGHDHKKGHFHGDGHNHADLKRGLPDGHYHGDGHDHEKAHFHGDGNKHHIDTEDYLTHFGYMNPFSFGAVSINDSLKKFQHTFGLKETGVADKETVDLMETPRCGMQDHIHGYSDKPWKMTDLTYSFDNYTPDMPRSEVEQLVRQALDYWAHVTPLTFTRKEKGGDITIAFGKRAHGDHKGKCFYNFDGPAGVLAHAFFPQSGRIHFDDEELFTAHSRRGINFLWVATHELGHILGLEHDTKDKDAVMYPYYRHYTPNFQLHHEDIRRVRLLYPRKIARPGCQDVARNCRRYKSRCRGHGWNWQKFMMAQCKKTCGFNC